MAITNIKCVIFDCDGTLVDSERLCCQALVNVFNQHGAELTMEECVSHFKGGKLADILLDTKKLMNINVPIDVLEPQYRTEVQKLFVRHLQPMDGAKRLIQFLDSHNIEYCVASNGPKDKIEYALELTGLLDAFKGKVFSAFEANSWKPEPDLIMYSAMSMGFLPSDCLYIDDTPKGVEAGLSAGIKTVQLFNGEAINRVDDDRVIRIQHLDELKEQLMGCSV
ncbi:HAD-IA family hydrolase [Vibrio parahaemolyticus]|uniref:HAD-IA family hydrolase n=1 Tax=Vibrio parahaemolyticus TaxID=670 RepID=UPI001D15F7E0|nr:HAD-IA family hydrolase [Vibrio parahaemolyticus]EGQ8804997.1 HAD-IA family hydrolase [Vibrio parahaemolyticus]EGQ8887625.1 HAD-IA family hydrolase [Vibrio parahaemolyticus]EGQ8962687.1 HAD-IA family hydrolase [Vibrio parahaemolyticus]EGR2851752.1 HAD family hydrolase [Vibrio parahaemolyticus]EGR3167465.1 HAD family hydrolase [Vibrio parahaemolyticus]